ARPAVAQADLQHVAAQVGDGGTDRGRRVAPDLLVEVAELPLGLRPPVRPAEQLALEAVPQDQQGQQPGASGRIKHGILWQTRYDGLGSGTPLPAATSCSASPMPSHALCSRMRSTQALEKSPRRTEARYSACLASRSCSRRNSSATISRGTAT